MYGISAHLAHHRDIGIETCICLAREGASVLMAGRDISKLKNAAAHVVLLCPAPPRIEWIQCDISDEKSVERMFMTTDDWGGVDVVFNNAAVAFLKDGGSVEVPEDIWDKIQQINVKGTWFCCKHAIISFRRNDKKRASVINNSSIVALVGSSESQLAYTTSKGAVLAMTRELAIVHGKEGFRFNSLCPGLVE